MWPRDITHKSTLRLLFLSKESSWEGLGVALLPGKPCVSERHARWWAVHTHQGALCRPVPHRLTELCALVSFSPTPSGLSQGLLPQPSLQISGSDKVWGSRILCLGTTLSCRSAPWPFLPSPACCYSHPEPGCVLSLSAQSCPSAKQGKAQRAGAQGPATVLSGTAGLSLSWLQPCLRVGD